MSLRISVIIPVYNAEKYLRRSVESAVRLPEVYEVLLIEDGSPDNSLEICYQLETEYDKVILFRHSDGENRGAGASRNLGIENAQGEIIAFLDADDWYLPHRFHETTEILESDPGCDGTYGPVGTFFEEEELEFFGKKMTKAEGDRKITFMKDDPTPEGLFDALVSRKRGSFHTNGIAFRKNLLKKTGLFNESLRLHQDMDLWYRLAYHGYLCAVSSVDPIAMRGVHGHNRVNQINKNSKSGFYASVFRYFQSKPISRKSYKRLFWDHVFNHPDRRHETSNTFSKYLELVLLTLKVSLFETDHK